LEEQADAEHMKAVKKQGIDGWCGHRFESSSGLTPEFALFARQFKTGLVKKMIGYTLEAWSRGHFYCSAFFKNNANGKYVHISCSDVRYSPDEWFNRLLVRTAEHVKDYTGGSNDYSTLTKVKEKADYLTTATSARTRSLK